MEDTLSAAREISHETEVEQLKRRYANELAQLEKKHAREHGEEQGIHGGAADQHWASEKYGSRSEERKALILRGMRMG